MNFTDGLILLYSQYPPDPTDRYAPEKAYSLVKRFDNGKWIGLNMTVLGSFRVVAGRTCDTTCHDLDLCAGPNEQNIEILYNVVYELLEKGVPFKLFPFQDKKPVFNCPRFMAELTELYGKELPTEDFPIDIPPITALRMHQASLLSSMWAEDRFIPPFSDIAPYQTSDKETHHLEKNQKMTG